MFCRSMMTLVAILVGITPALSQEKHVEVSAEIERVSETRATLTVTGEVLEGLHIYAQSQPEPFLPAKFTIERSEDAIVQVGEFVSQTPIHYHHNADLDADLHELEGRVTWVAELTVRGEGPIAIRGSLFAQACGKEACFAPQNYSFTATSSSNDSVGIGATPNEPLIESTEQGSGKDGLGKDGLGEVPFDAFLANVASHSPRLIDTNADLKNSVPAEEAENSDTGFVLSELKVESTQTQTIWAVLPLAFAAGFLLNFMPCVLPVVGLKLLSFVQQANSDRKQILMMNLAYTAGLLTVMMMLATMAVFAGFGWGEQFSSAWFTIALSAIVFAFGLSFLGVWEIPMPGVVGKVSGKTKQEGYAGAFSKGVLSTLLATPCSGPFLGAALAWAVTQSAVLTYGVFAAVGIGMASPYLVIGVFPSMIRFLPKPGDWMVGFKQIMGFVMLATVVYLMSFMPVAAVVPSVLLLLGLGFGLWWAGRTPSYAPAGEQMRAWSLATTFVVVTGAISFGWLQGVMQSRFERAAERLYASASTDSLDRVDPTKHVVSDQGEDSIAWHNYSPEFLESLIREGKPVFVDFTADWCLTCKSNETTAIERPEVIAALRRGNVVALRADKTEPNAAADRLLRQLGNSAASIPFYAFFPAENPNKPITMDGLYAGPQPFLASIAEAVKVEKSGDY